MHTTHTHSDTSCETQVQRKFSAVERVQREREREIEGERIQREMTTQNY